MLRQANTYYEFTDRDFDNKPIVIREFDKGATSYGINLQNFIVQLPQPAKMNCIVFREAIWLGQTIRRFKIVLYNGTKVIREIQGSSVGRKRIITFPTETVTSFRVYVADARGNDNISGVAAYLLAENLLGNRN